MEKNRYYLHKLILLLDSQTQCYLFDVQLLWSYDYSKCAIFTKKPYFTMENFKFREAVKWGLKIFAPNYQRHTLTPNLVEQIVWHMWQ